MTAPIDITSLRWAMLRHPAWMPCRGPDGQFLRLGRDTHLAADLWVRAIASHLSTLLPHPITFTACRDGWGQGPQRPAVAFDLLTPDAGQLRPRLTIALDAPAARALADATGSRFAGVRGSGSLAAEELALIEFLILEALTMLDASGDRPPRPWSLGDFTFAPELAEAHICSAAACGAIMAHDVLVGARHGRIWCVLHEPLLRAAAFPPSACELRDDPTQPRDSSLGTIEVTLGVALPVFALSHAQWANTQPGDCLLPGQSVLTGALGCSLATTTGWSLASLIDVCDTPTHIICRLAASPDPRPLDQLHPCPPGFGSIAVIIGQLPLGPIPVDRLPHLLHDGVSLTIPKDPAAPALILLDGLPVARGELCLIEPGQSLTDVAGGDPPATSNGHQPEVAIRIIERIDTPESAFTNGIAGAAMLSEGFA